MLVMQPAGHSRHEKPNHRKVNGDHSRLDAPCESRKTRRRMSANVQKIYRVWSLVDMNEQEYRPRGCRSDRAGPQAAYCDVPASLQHLPA
jgi:hypothetical protein